MRIHKKLIACMLVFGFSSAQAGPADLILTPFTGPGIVQTDLEAITNYQTLPWTDPDGRTFNGPTIIASGLGLGNGDFTISNLGPDVYRVGWYWLNYVQLELSNVAFSNGDSYSVLTPAPATNSFIGFESNTPFTSVTLTFSGDGSGNMTDFITQAVVPEPSTVISSVICALAVGVVAYRKHRGRRMASA